MFENLKQQTTGDWDTFTLKLLRKAVLHGKKKLDSRSTITNCMVAFSKSVNPLEPAFLGLAQCNNKGNGVYDWPEKCNPRLKSLMRAC